MTVWFELSYFFAISLKLFLYPIRLTYFLPDWLIQQSLGLTNYTNINEIFLSSIDKFIGETAAV